MSRHPIQPMVMDDGVLRFKSNAIVRFLLDAGPYDLNKLAMMTFSDDDRAQLAQLIGYSFSGWQELSYVSDGDVERARDTASMVLDAHDRGASTWRPERTE